MTLSRGCDRISQSTLNFIIDPVKSYTMTIDLTLACTEYDWTRPLWDGDVEPEGINLHLVDYHNPERFERMVKHGEFDMCEMSWGSYLSSRSNPEEFGFTAIPVFPYRRFRHSFIYKRAGDDISLGDIEGKDVGMIHWQTTTHVYQRGIAREHYGVDLEKVNWHTVKSEGDIVPISVPDRFNVDFGNYPGRTSEILIDKLVDGDLDVAFYTGRLEKGLTGRHDTLEKVESGQEADSQIERIFENSIEVEQEYYEKTNVFPLMHAIVIDDDILEQYPWVANKMYNAFEEALELCMRRLEKPRWFPVVWANQHLEHQKEVMGENPWEYGLTDQNLTSLNKLLEYAENHGLISRQYDPEELFVESTLTHGYE